MEKRIENVINRKTEFLIIAMYFIHHFFMFLGAMRMKWDNWIAVILILTGLATIIVFVGQYWNVKSRAIFASTMVCIALAFYGVTVGNIASISLPLLAVVVIMGLYSIEGLMMLPTVTFTFLVFYYVFVTKTITLESFSYSYDHSVPIVNVYFIIAVIYVWVKNRNISHDNTEKVISSLKVAERGKDDFLANVSHEIRTPINAISGMSEVILREDELSDKVREEILDIQISGRQLVSVVSDILDFSELQSGKQELSENEYNVSTTIYDIINMANAMKKEKNIELVIECDAKIPSILIGDEQRIRRVILNLLNNAIKFTNDGCVVLKIEFRKEYYGINMAVTVRDTGIGMDKEHIEKLFTSYNQVDTKRNRQEGGIGLGLAISKTIIEKMGGFITVSSELGRGSEFKFVIPQKVKDEKPIVSMEDAQEVNILIYINLEQFHMIQIRDAYSNMINNLAEQLGIAFHNCHNLQELKRRAAHSYVTHIFISFVEYNEDKEFFNEIAEKCVVIVAIDELQEKNITSDKVLRLYKPFYVLPITNILCGKVTNVTTTVKRFIAPEAKILVVDDNLINLKVISGLLKPYEAQVVTVTSGMEALEKIEEKCYDLVFMDHMMPEMDGVETLQRIRAKNNLYYKEVPIIALTANAVAGAREMFLNEGFQEFVSKPVELSVVNRVLKNFLSDEKIVYVSDDYISPKKNAEKKSSETSEEAPSTEATSADDELKLGDINIDEGITYCGTKEDYIDVLKIHCTNGDKNKKEIQKFYDEQDWKNYTILVHGLKSSMKSIGAEKLSEMAKHLEAAGKLNEAEYILSNHDEMMVEYERILGILYEYFGITVEPEQKVDVSNLPEISEDEFSELLSGMEAAMYEWDGDKMSALAEKLKGHCYEARAIDEILDVIFNKINMSDYMSAYETLKNWKENH